MSTIRLFKLHNANAIEVDWLDEAGNQTKCRTYSSDQLDELKVDIGEEYTITYTDVIEEVEALVVPYQPSVDEYVSTIMDYIQAMLDEEARSIRPIYYDMATLCSYENSSIPELAAEGRMGVLRRDAVWVKCSEMLDECISGARLVPYTLEDVLASLPASPWA